VFHKVLSTWSACHRSILSPLGTNFTLTHIKNKSLKMAASDKPWADALAASFLVQLATFSGLLLTAFSAICARTGQRKGFLDKLHSQLVPAFAGGALIATAVFLIIPESLELIGGGGHAEEGHAEEGTTENTASQVAYKFGVALMAGYLLPILLGALFPTPDLSDCVVCRDEQEGEQPQAAVMPEEVVLKRQASINETLDLNCEEGHCSHHKHKATTDAEKDPEAEVMASDASAILPTSTTESKNKGKQLHKLNVPLISSILIGDAFHNFTDGIFIGNALLLCSRSVAYTIVVTTIYHEIAQEIADFVLLTHHGGLGKPMALALNFCSGFSVMIGAVLILWIDLSHQATGILLAMSAGVYLYISTSECIPRVTATHKKAVDTLWFLVCFAIGAAPIGLVLLNHGHCEA
jgi:zinc transporter ZupT